jgi:hypothetical protein
MLGSRRVAVAAVFSVCMLASAGVGPVFAKGHPGSSSGTTGNDISWPQCGGAYPSGQAFGIVGVNGGLANELNPCLESELAWAAASSGTTLLPTAALYVNTANPGQVTPTVADWPTDNVDPAGADQSNVDPHGTCSGGDDLACSWQYGWDRAVQDLLWLEATSGGGFSNVPADYPWWLDVETGNSWESGADGLANNAADLQGMVSALRATIGDGQTIGIYSTSYQWSEIVGTNDGQGVLNSLPVWIPGARTEKSAKSNCGLPSFTGGQVRITQWFGHYDGDVSCLG